MNFVLRSSFESALILAVAAPLIAIAMWRARARGWLALLAMLGVFVLDNFLLRVPRIGPFAALEWSWQGKVLEIVMVIAIVACSPSLSWRDIGVTAPLRPGWHVPVLVLIAVGAALPVLFLVAFDARDALTVEGWLFEATVPGIAEELVFRGVLLALCDRAFGRPWRIAGAEVGWGAIVTAVIFAAVHAINVDRDGGVQIEPLLALGPLIGGLVVSWGRARIGQIVPLMAIHNLSNLIIPFASLWLV